MSSPHTARAVLYVVLFLSIVLLITTVYAGSHAPIPRTQVHECAAVVERGGSQTCR